MYESNFVNLYSPYSLRALRVANRLFSANKEINEIANIDWKLVLIDADAINAIAFPVHRNLEIYLTFTILTAYTNYNRMVHWLFLLVCWILLKMMMN
jgi:hypothetical protein